jgi:hypothetical protein
MEITPTTLRVRGVQPATISTVSPVGDKADFCIPWWAIDKDHGWVSGFHNGRPVRYPLEPTGEITDEMVSRNSTVRNLTEVAMILTGGNDWHGRPVVNEAFHAADFARLLLNGGLLWTLEDEAFGTVEGIPEVEEGIRNKYEYRKALSEEQGGQLKASLESFAGEGNATRFLDAAGTAGKGRRRFRTESGLRGLGPGAMKPGDRLCVVDGASAPIVLREKGDGHEVIGECFVYLEGLGKGEEALQAVLRELRVQVTWLKLV